MLRQTLHEQWTLRVLPEPADAPAELIGRAIPAEVPGCVHTDLLRNSLIPDPYLDCNERDLQWIGLCDWEYATSFDADPDLLAMPRVDLVCEGLDTVAEVTLNGSHVATTADQHVVYRNDVKSLLRARDNELVIVFKSAVRYARQHEARLGPLPHTGPYAGPWNFIRKMACNFGWDWGPMLVTAGIWKPIALEGWSGVRVAAVRPLVHQASEQAALLNVHVDVETEQAMPEDLRVSATARLTGPDGRTIEASATGRPGQSSVLVPVEVDRPALWWPVGYGDHPLYDLDVTAAVDGTQTRPWKGRTGLRMVELDAGPDDIGRRFAIKVNGKEVFCKGANWIPDDCFPTRVDEARYRRRLQQSVDANMNMLRVWGGGIFETDTFYDLCDEMGLMVWQDFLFACACYPEEPPFDALVEAEARDNVTRLARHPSLVIWNGCNENVLGYFEWGWKDKVEGRAWGLGYYLELLPRVLEELDPSRPYWPASPYSGSMDVHPNDGDHGNKHFWKAWFGEFYDVYRQETPRFCSEFGFQAPATWATMKQAMPNEALRFGSDAMAHRQRSGPGDANNERHVSVPFGPPDLDDFDSTHYLMQLNQARALTLGVEWFRSLQPVCMGTLYWQINDCWPVTSWAAIDGYGRFKPLYYATRRFYAPRVLSFQPDSFGESVPRLCVLNDTDAAWTQTVRISRRRFDGNVLAEADVAVDVPPRGVGRMELDPALTSPEDASQELILADTGEARAFWYFAHDKELHYPQPSFDADLQRVGKALRLSLRANSFVRDLAIFVDRLDPHAVIDDQLLTLLPGETAVFMIDSDQPLDAVALTRRPVLQCANFYGRPAPTA